MELHLRATGCYLLHGAQCHLPPDTREHTLPLSQPNRPIVNLLVPVTGYIPRWFTYPQTVTYPRTNPAVTARSQTCNLLITSPTP